MGPHLNQNLYLRVVDKGTMKETGRIIQQITTADFDVVIDAVTAGRSYFNDFFSDHNSNGLYDVPPVDHAWRLELNNAVGGDELNFAHNTNFTDINWKYLLTVNLFLMTPHLGELFELRVVRQDNQVEIGRVSVPAVLVPDFTVYIPQFELNQGYNIDFYTDHNGNGIYDAPPTDHAWRLSFNSSTGDFVQDFTHNTNFTDIQWPNPSGVNENEFSDLNDYQLFQNYHNPFNLSTKIKYTIPQPVIASETKQS
jgi:hypothetical protein